jgi:hypothetical protein
MALTMHGSLERKNSGSLEELGRPKILRMSSRGRELALKNKGVGSLVPDLRGKSQAPGPPAVQSSIDEEVASQEGDEDLSSASSRQSSRRASDASLATNASLGTAGIRGLPPGVLPNGRTSAGLPPGVLPSGRTTSGLPPGVLPSGRTTSAEKLSKFSMPELEETPDIDEPIEKALDGEHTAMESNGKTKWMKALKKVIRQLPRDRSEESNSCLDRFGNVKFYGSMNPEGEDHDLNPTDLKAVQPVELASTSCGSTSSTLSSFLVPFHDQSPRISNTSTGSLVPTPSRRSSILEGKLDAQIVDLRLFDFALPKGKAKIEITYIEISVPGVSTKEGTREMERLVLKPEQVKRVHMLCRGCEELPIQLEAFNSNSESFPLTKTFPRPERLRYPTVAELTFELRVKNICYITQPHLVTLSGTKSIFTRLHNLLEKYSK